MKDVKRCAIYARVSTTEQDCELQLREMRQFAALRGWQIVGEYVDHGFTGTNSNRPELKRLMTDSKKRKHDLVLVWKLDRFARSLKEIVLMLQELSEIGVEFVSQKDNLDLSTSQGRLMMHMIAAFSQFEADLIKMRVKAGLENARAKGIMLGRPKKRDDQKIRQLRSEGHSLRQVAKLAGVSTMAVQRSLKCV